MKRCGVWVRKSVLCEQSAVLMWQFFTRVSVWILVFAFCALDAHAQVTFSPAVNVSNDAGNSQRPQIAVDAQGNINLVWLDSTPGILSVFFSHSTNSGATFSTPVNLSNNPGGSALFPQVAVDSNGNIFVAWFDSNSGNPSIFIRRSVDGGATFSAAISQTAVRWPIFIAVDAFNRINVVWAANDSAGVPQVVFSSSANAGMSLSAPLTISSATGGVSTSSLGSSLPGYMALDANGYIHVTWIEVPSPQGPANILFGRSADGGATFSAPKQVVSSGSPQIGIAGLTVDGSGSIHVLWASLEGNVYNAYLNRSSDSGATFAAENFQTGYTGFYPFAGMAADSRGGVNLIWNSSGQNPLLNFARSKDEGANFATKTIAGGDYSDPGAPSILTDAGGNIDVVWAQGGGPSTPGGMMFARSSDSGQTFSSSQQVTSAVGQDLAVVTDTSGHVYTAWSQVVTTGNGDIFFSRGANAPAPSISLSAVSLGAPSATGGNAVASTVTLSGAAPASGATVSLVSSNPGVAAVPASVAVSSGATSGSFSVITSAVASPTALTISATLNGVTQTSPLTVVPPALAGLSLSPSSVTSGNSSTGTITLTGPASSGGLVVTLASSQPKVAHVPANMTVPAGSTSATFAVRTGFVHCASQTTISGTLNGVRMTADLTVESRVNLPPMVCGGPGVGRGGHPPVIFNKCKRSGSPCGSAWL